MKATESFEAFVAPRIAADAALRHALIEETMRCVLEGDVAVALVHIRDILDATSGHDAMARALRVPRETLEAVIAEGGEPKADELGRVIAALVRLSGVRVAVQVEPLHAAE
jgi:DNA-binding phage protein